MADPVSTDGPKAGALTTALPSNAVTAVTSLACTGGSALTIPIPAGAEIVLYSPTTGIRQSGIYTASAAAIGATSVATAQFIAAQGLGVGTEIHLPGVAGAVFTVLRGTWPGTAAGTDGTLDLGVVPPGLPSTAYVSAVNIVSPSTVALSATLFETFTVSDFRAGASNGVVATQTTTATNLTAQTPVTPAVTQPTAAVASGDVFSCAVTHASTGTALPAGLIVEVVISY